jgi:small subunit ribosomal protein S7
LLPGSPPPAQLPLNPLLYLTLAIDAVAPIIRVRSLKGLAGGGNALEVPEPIDARARRRQAIAWILDIVNKKRSMGSGRKQFATRFGQEIVAVIEGRSAVWDRRQVVHKMGTAARANLTHPNIVGKKRR